ncbi:MAG TPA: rhodanese-like domain-containing protein [Candidatus Binataceae bacterium]|nr:rhodanese-like domain-containing protein [Candidatus Binataceae bacterium]
MAETISADQLGELMRSDSVFALIDVREWGEFSLEQVLGARNIARGSLEKYLPFLVPRRDVPVVFVCADGARSTLAAKTAQAVGYSRVRVLTQGIAGWTRAGGETYGGWSLTGKDYGERLLVHEDVPEMTVDELHRTLAAGERVCILDSRPRSEYRASHLPGAHSAPIGHIALMVTDLASDSTVPVVTNCAGRTRSIIAAHLLRRMNLPNPVYALKGGTGAWRIAGWGDELASGDDPALAPSSPSSLAAAAEFAMRLRSEDRIALVTPSEVRSRIAANELLYILDLRPGAEYAAGHIAGARLCDGTQVQFAVDALVGVQNAPIVTVCDGHVRATVAASLLRGMGYSNVAVLEGGYPAWTACGYESEVGAPFEIDYGEPAWLARFLQDFPSGLGKPRELPVPGIEAARRGATFVSADALCATLGTPRAPVVIDLRGAGEFAIAHLPGARWLSRGWLELRISEVARADARVVLYSRNDTRSVLAALTLTALGYRDVAVLQGGFENWKRRALEIEDGFGSQPELEETATAEIGLFGVGKFGYSNERMARYLKDEEALGRRHRKPGAAPL